MINLLTVIGARPQIIKAAALSRTIDQHFKGRITEHLLHTGQHYDQNMSQVFFDELGIPAPEFNLGVGSGSHGEQTAKMIVGIESVLCQNHFDGIVLYGDTNSTLAGAVAASKLQVPIFHIEAGLRSFNMTMPEEVNRIVCDQLSSILFAPTQTAVDNLRAEGLDRRSKVVKSGDVMYDNCLHFAPMADAKSGILGRLGLKANDYVLATIHRDFNTDDPIRLRSIFEALGVISKMIPVVMPLHPRTKACLQSMNLDASYENIRIIPPASFFEILSLQQHAQVVVTDSGGVQKEAFFLECPCVIIRPETEWVEIVEQGAGIIADANQDRILEAYRTLSGKKVTFPELFGTGRAAQVILKEIEDYFGNND